MAVRISGLLGQVYLIYCSTKLPKIDQLIMSTMIIHTLSVQERVCAWYTLKCKLVLIFFILEHGYWKTNTGIFVATCNFSQYKSLDTVYCKTYRGVLLERSGLS